MYSAKYQKYKTKYNYLKSMIGGVGDENEDNADFFETQYHFINEYIEYNEIWKNKVLVINKKILNIEANKINYTFISKFGGIEVDSKDHEFWYSNENRIIGVNWPDYDNVRKILGKQKRFISDYIYDHGIFGNFYLFNEASFIVQFETKEGDLFIFFFNNTESIYHAIKLYMYYLLDNTLLSSEFHSIVDEFANNPQKSWAESRQKKDKDKEQSLFNKLEVKHKPEWNKVSWQIMIILLNYKATMNKEFRQKLLDSKNAYIAEDSSNNSEWAIFDAAQTIYDYNDIIRYSKGNIEGDNGLCGQNKLGKSLMILRVLLMQSTYQDRDTLLNDYGIYKNDKKIITSQRISELKVNVNFIKKLWEDKDIRKITLFKAVELPKSEIIESKLMGRDIQSIKEHFDDAFHTYPNRDCCNNMYKEFDITATLSKQTNDTIQTASYYDSKKQPVLGKYKEVIHNTITYRNPNSKDLVEEVLEMPILL